MSLLKTFVRWCINGKGFSDEESEATSQKMLFTLKPNFWYACVCSPVSSLEINSH